MTDNQTNWQELCAHLYIALAARSTWDDDDALLDLARAALQAAEPEHEQKLPTQAEPEPEPEGLTDEEILALSQEHGVSYTMLDGGVIYGRQEGNDVRDDVLSFAYALLARWGK